MRVDAALCTQAQALHRFAQVASPDLILREMEMARDLPKVARCLKVKGPPALSESVPDTSFDLADIYDDDIEKAVTQAYQRDYVMFGFRRWA